MSQRALDDVRAAIERTTPGEWTYQDRGGKWGLVHYRYSGGRSAMGIDSSIRSADAAWIARSREDARALLGEIERLRSLLAKEKASKARQR